MRFRNFFLRVGLSVVLIGSGMGMAVTAFAIAPPPPLAAPSGLVITEIKVTGDEFAVLQNNSTAAISDLSKYWLYVFSKTNPLAAGATSSAQQLPVAALPAGASVLLSEGGATCGAAVTAKLALSFGDSAGALQVLSAAPNGLLVPTPTDAVSWSANADGDIPNVPKSTTDKQAAFYRTQNTSKTYGWQLADVAIDGATGLATICRLNVGTAGSAQPAVGGQLAAPIEPSATIINWGGSASSATTATMPASDIGLSAPRITELLPNPNGTGTDATDEFIELYNANPAPFDLSGFTLQTGAVTKHSYIFPAGTALPAQSFTAFYASTTGLTLSNSGGQADLLDPSNDVLSQTDVYGTAKDGQAWALADGTWHWTTQATPGLANVIAQPPATKTAKKQSSQTAGTVKGAATTTGSKNSASAEPAGTNTAPIHPLVLAAVAAIAVGYGVYEYRHDLANRIHRLRTNRAARRSARPQLARR